MCRIPISDIATLFHDSYFSRLFVFSYCRTVLSVKSRNVINEFNLKLNWRTRAFSLTSNLLHARATFVHGRVAIVALLRDALRYVSRNHR